jgi:hypothetical protein
MLGLSNYRIQRHAPPRNASQRNVYLEKAIIKLSNRPARVTQAEISRALRAIKKLGMSHEITILPDGSIRITPTIGGKVPPGGAKDAADVVMGRLEA